MTSHSKEIQCQSCAKRFEVEIFEPLFGIDFGLPNICEPCSDLAEAEGARKARETKARERWEACVPAAYRETDAAHPDYPVSVHDACQSWLKGIAPDGEKRPFLGIVGRSGICKTRVISQMVKRLIWEGAQVYWLNSARFQWACQNQFNDANARKASELLDRVRQAQVLVFDDIGSLKASEVVSDALYGILEDRGTKDRAMLWTSNEAIEEMLQGAKLTAHARKRNVSRLAGYSNVIKY